MKSLISNVFVVTLFVCLSVKHVSSIKCYDCKTSLYGTSDEECRDKFGVSLIRECQASVCSIEVKTQDNGEGSITRACGSDLNGTVIGAEITSAADHGQYTDDGAHVSWSTCTTDLCNWDVSHGHRIRRALEDMFGDLNRKLGSIDRYDKFDNHANTRKIQCYECATNPFDDDDTTCRQKDMQPTTCLTGACRIFKFAFQGDDVVVRTCDDPHFYQLAAVFPKKNLEYFRNGEFSRFGMELSWSTCTTDLCNWGVMNKYQTVTLFVSAMLSLAVYCTIF